MERYIEKVGTPISGIQKFALKDCITGQVTQFVNVPEQKADSFEKLMDKAQKKSAKLGQSQAEMNKKTKQRAIIGITVFPALGAGLALLLTKNKSKAVKIISTVLTSLGGLITGIVATAIPPAAISSLHYLKKAMKLSTSCSNTPASSETTNELVTQLNNEVQNITDKNKK